VLLPCCEYRKRTEVLGEEQRRALVQQETNPELTAVYEKQPNSISVYWEKESE